MKEIVTIVFTASAWFDKPQVRFLVAHNMKSTSSGYTRTFAYHNCFLAAIFFALQTIKGPAL